LERLPLSRDKVSSPNLIAWGLADAFVSGPWQLDDMVERGGRALGRRPRWLRPLAQRVLDAHGSGGRPAPDWVAAFLSQDSALLRACERNRLALSTGRWLAPVMAPAPGPPSSWTVPAITTPAELAKRLGLTLAELDWFADLQRRERTQPAGPLRHYVYLWQSKRNGSSRLIESPKPRLKTLQRRILEEILAPIPPHEAAHGFRRGRSVRTFVAPHVGRRVVLKLDLRDFFATITMARVAALFRTVGYPEAVARALAGLCTNSVPSDVWNDPGGPVDPFDRTRTRRLYLYPHLPQGAPTSPALANLGAFSLDVRLDGLARSAEARYTRYADDLVFSGGRRFERSISRFQVQVAAIALEEGFALNFRKTRAMRQGVRQQVAGVVVNAWPNLARSDYDALKATLHNCVRHGPEGQNHERQDDFRAHLAGRIAHVAALNPARAERLRMLFDRIAW
jgi:hypothetical protein